MDRDQNFGETWCFHLPLKMETRLHGVTFQHRITSSNLLDWLHYWYATNLQQCIQCIAVCTVLIYTFSSTWMCLYINFLYNFLWIPFINDILVNTSFCAVKMMKFLSMLVLVVFLLFVMFCNFILSYHFYFQRLRREGWSFWLMGWIWQKQQRRN